ncbi:hypothetical protein [Haladaptatus sp. T7]|uniref:hypothetical protein n=1 Tax=Haladaptatus sp. T7 TaxID=2029368 RepID=UPI0021A254C3|nr:hypothetical protein [Haladaptatus sp. T7]GKZ16069.1 hypothetical protein HAL_39500 [Haladaptatus sp. T7]
MGKSEPVPNTNEDNSEGYDSNSSDADENEYQVIKSTKIREMLRDETELQVSPEADEAMIKALNEVAAVITAETIKVAERKSEGSTVRSGHVETAYSQIKKPHNSLFRAINQIDDARAKIKAMADSSPFSDKNIND